MFDYRTDPVYKVRLALGRPQCGPTDATQRRLSATSLDWIHGLKARATKAIEGGLLIAIVDPSIVALTLVALTLVALTTV